MRTQEVIEPTVRLTDSEAAITLDQEAAQAIYNLAETRVSESITKLNDAYDEMTSWASPHERAKELLWIAEDLKRAAEVVYWLTPLPEDLEEVPTP